MAILKLDDFISNDEDSIELQGHKYTFNLSLKALIKFQKWSSKNSDETLLEASSEDLIKIIINEYEDFINVLSTLNAKSQIKILQSVIQSWSNAMLLESKEAETTEKK